MSLSHLFPLSWSLLGPDQRARSHHWHSKHTLWLGEDMQVFQQGQHTGGAHYLHENHCPTNSRTPPSVCWRGCGLPESVNMTSEAQNLASRTDFGSPRGENSLQSSSNPERQEKNRVWEMDQWEQVMFNSERSQNCPANALLKPEESTCHLEYS